MTTRSLLLITLATALVACRDEAKDPSPIYPSSTGSGDGSDTEDLCGNGMIDEGEQCDGVAQPCSDFGLGQGMATCNLYCQLDVSQCAGAADDTAGGGDGGGPCDPEMINYDCQGIAYGIYENGTDRIMEVIDGGSASSGRTLACIGAEVNMNAGQHHFVALPACGVNGGYSEAMVRQQCTEECETTLGEQNPFPDQITASNKVWELVDHACFFGSDIDTSAFGAGLINALGPTQALGPQGCGFGTSAPDSGVAQPGPVSCGETTCAEIDCSQYTPATMVGSASSGRAVRSWIDTTFAQTIIQDMLLPFCGEGRYVWNSDTPTRARFERLGAGEVFYDLGFRNNDRLLQVQRYVPLSSDPSTGVPTGTIYPLTSQTEMIDAADALNVSDGGEHYLRIAFKRGTGTYYNWVRIIDIAT